MRYEKLIKKGDEISITIDSLSYGGKGVGKTNNFVLFVQGALPSEKVVARVVKKRSGYAEAIIVKTIQESPHFTSPSCEHFPTCGGCSLQHLNYTEQLAQKKQQVIDLFQRIGGIEEVPLKQVIPSGELFHYRNKMEFTFSNRRWILPDEEKGVDASFALGLHIPNRFDKVLDINTCWIQKPVSDGILRAVKNETKKLGLKPYDIIKHKGYLRNLVIRVGERTGDVMVNIVTSREEPELLLPIVDMLVTEFPQVTSIVNNITKRKAGVAFGEREVVLFGTPYIRDKIGEHIFEISANSFFQTNTIQAENVYKIARELANFSGDDVVYDLYSGTGSLSIFMAGLVKQVYGFELIQSAVEDAVRNAVNNGAYNCQFYHANLDRFFRVTPILKKIEKPDVILIDPPRAGMHPKLVKDVIHMSPQKIVYISCNPSTQARDILVMIEGNYKLDQLAIVDMFPHTPYIETVALIRK